MHNTYKSLTAHNRIKEVTLRSLNNYCAEKLMIIKSSLLRFRYG
ncbi:hypothetical protein T11_8954 [Trichinella zimbabwensis]|uniref:Uncharacterized protein n=1 Tax=Trichinella zimbabwensis TaxID=268475 RepID=A0A0V1GD33_9BILA|nr:hypothetical protein T11_8954 [Trichinella zimbabwensis]